MKKLYRSRKDKMIAGICGGLGDYFDVDSTLVRVLFLVLVFSGVWPIVYLLLWLVIPREPAK
ncbi:PspC domain-containing protein [Candidatus Saccharibacteria bacterium]|nr:PspC domain-containing protein [Candidatus Saccharibacteria bacterium]HPG37309.1 PspC domain-containing protein [Candidatus Saccharibacteria bacterium]